MCVPCDPRHVHAQFQMLFSSAILFILGGVQVWRTELMYVYLGNAYIPDEVDH